MLSVLHFFTFWSMSTTVDSTTHHVLATMNSSFPLALIKVMMKLIVSSVFNKARRCNTQLKHLKRITIISHISSHLNKPHTQYLHDCSRELTHHLLLHILRKRSGGFVTEFEAKWPFLRNNSKLKQSS